MLTEVQQIDAHGITAVETRREPAGDAYFAYMTQSRSFYEEGCLDFELNCISPQLYGESADYKAGVDDSKFRLVRAAYMTKRQAELTHWDWWTAEYKAEFEKRWLLDEF